MATRKLPDGGGFWRAKEQRTEAKRKRGGGGEEKEKEKERGPRLGWVPRCFA